MTFIKNIRNRIAKNDVKLTVGLFWLSLFYSGPSHSIELKRRMMEVSRIQNSIRTLEDISPDKSYDIAKSVYFASVEYNIDPKLILSILKVESSFRQEAISETGDFSIAQINLRVWKQELERLSLEPIDEYKIKTDGSYAILRMAEILSLLRNRHKGDNDWFATYHSVNSINKEVYKLRVLAQFDKIKNID